MTWFTKTPTPDEKFNGSKLNSSTSINVNEMINIDGEPFYYIVRMSVSRARGVYTHRFLGMTFWKSKYEINEYPMQTFYLDNRNLVRYHEDSKGDFAFKTEWWDTETTKCVLKWFKATFPNLGFSYNFSATGPKGNNQKVEELETWFRSLG